MYESNVQELFHLLVRAFATEMIHLKLNLEVLTLIKVKKHVLEYINLSFCIGYTRFILIL